VSLITPFPENLTNFDVSKSEARQNFDRWANQLREATSLRLKKTGRGGVGGGDWWWERLPGAFQVFILSTVAGDDWERWHGCRWSALPEGLRSEIAAQCRALGRVVEGCPWR